MKGDPKVIEALNEILTGELTAINQYFLHSRMCKSWGYLRLGQKMYEESISEMKHASVLTDRVLLLDGIPNLQRLGTLHIGENVKEQLESDKQLELDALKKLRSAVAVCYTAKDHASRELLEQIIVSEEEHIDWLESQLHVIEEIGLENYLVTQVNPS